ncbi:uncharacterized protein [Rutidosis leptorrhynchoides]|uniref:uncharacterized protein n=1 Tax=Rutidosis leptorrhynchoides TaxID=125765 RepID=UPI003A9954DD
MSWVKWEDILLPYESGGLNLGSLKCKNLALIGKWWWRFKRLVRFDPNLNASVHDRIVWDGSKCSGNWCWSRIPFDRAGSELIELNNLIVAVTINSGSADSRRWQGSSTGQFTTKKLTEQVADKVLIAGPNTFETFHNNLVPKKVEIFMWRARKGRLPVLTELDKSGVDLYSTRCPICDDSIETVDHSFILCKLEYDNWSKVFDWWGLGVSNLSVGELFRGASNLYMTSEGCSIWQAVEWSCGYLIWKNRNQKVFKNKCWTIPIALNEIQLLTFEWIAKRFKSKPIDWHTWLHNPQRLVT